MNTNYFISKCPSRKTLAAIAVSSALLFSAPAALAVDGSSIVKGHIENVSGQSIANATITLKHKAKGLVYTVSTNENGEYILRNVPVGEYDISS
ncbi:MAG: carboxypeptidase regulatory-like domain-containing protein [Shewanella sp.]|nr:carboxypeptidase regulatory-like domain-containing protein [Shewanella sp.]